MQLKIITHERIIFEGEADEIVIQAQTGQIGILKDHIPFTTVLEVGVTKKVLDTLDAENISYDFELGKVYAIRGKSGSGARRRLL